MTELQMIEALLGAYAAPAVVTGFIVLKGVAAIVNNNVSTTKWPKWLRGGLDWLSSADKQAKETGDSYVDMVLEANKEVDSKSVSKVVKVLKLFS